MSSDQGFAAACNKMSAAEYKSKRDALAKPLAEMGVDVFEFLPNVDWDAQTFAGKLVRVALIKRVELLELVQLSGARRLPQDAQVEPGEFAELLDRLTSRKRKRVE